MPKLLIELDTKNSFSNRTERFLSGIAFESAKVTAKHMLSTAGINTGKGLSRNMTEMIRKHLDVNKRDVGTNYQHMGFATGHLKSNSAWKAVKGEIIDGKTFYDAIMTYELDIPQYGYAIGSSNGFKFSPKIWVLEDWIKSKIAIGNVDFYVLKKGVKSPIETDEDLESAAYAMIKNGIKKKSVGLPKWYSLRDAEKETIRGIMKRMGNLAFAKTKDELSKKYK